MKQKYLTGYCPIDESVGKFITRADESGMVCCCRCSFVTHLKNLQKTIPKDKQPLQVSNDDYVQRLKKLQEDTFFNDSQ